MDARVGPQERGGRLVPRLYLLLVAIFLPTLAAYYFYNKRVMETLQEREVDDTIHKTAFRVEALLGEFDLAWLVTENIFVEPEEVARKKADRDRLERELTRVAAETMGVEGAAVFAAEGDRGLRRIARAGGAQDKPSFEDVEAVYVQGRTLRNDTMRGDDRILAVSIPVKRWNAAEKRDDPIGAIHLDVSPANIGLRFPDWQRGLLLGALGTMLLLGLGVAVFVHTAVRKPALELVEAMQRASEGNLSALVEPRTGEMGWLAGSYNQMMRRLKQSMDENGRLLTQIQGFNEELKRKVAAATQELEQRNTELGEANEKLFLVQRQMTTLEKLATLGQLATTIAHELGTPLNAISGHLQLLGEEEVGARARERLKVIDAQVDRLIGIVRDVLKSMRVPEPRLEPTDLNRVIEEVLALIAPMVEKRGIRVNLRLAADLPQIPGDSGQIEQVLMNLFTNSMDAMTSGQQAGSARGTLSVATAFVSPAEAARLSRESDSPLPEGSYLRVDVSDTGMGMDEETARNAFEPFFSTKAGEGRLGLGLAICRQIVKSHQGEVSIRSEAGKGTTFSLFLPVERDRVLLESRP